MNSYEINASTNDKLIWFCRLPQANSAAMNSQNGFPTASRNRHDDSSPHFKRTEFPFEKHPLEVPCARGVVRESLPVQSGIQMIDFIVKEVLSRIETTSKHNEIHVHSDVICGNIISGGKIQAG